VFARLLRRLSLRSDVRPSGRRSGRPWGQATVEFALILPVLLLLVMGAMETGRLFNAYLIISNGAREGARLGSVQGTSSAIVTKVQSVTSTLNAASRTITVTGAQGAAGGTVTVTVVYRFAFITPLIGRLFPSNPYNLTAQVAMRLE
jgi:Flp pilus assembly protein TadG